MKRILLATSEYSRPAVGLRMKEEELHTGYLRLAVVSFLVRLWLDILYSKRSE